MKTTGTSELQRRVGLLAGVCAQQGPTGTGRRRGAWARAWAWQGAWVMGTYFYFLKEVPFHRLKCSQEGKKKIALDKTYKSLKPSIAETG